MNENRTKCDCRTLENLASDHKSPIQFDKDLNEYNLVAGGGKVHYRLYFCFFCGGKLPQSRRDSLFAEPSAEEVNEVAQLLSKVASMQQVMRLLGKPDETVKPPKAAVGENGKSK